MKFADLLKLPFDVSGISPDALAAALPDTPADIREQLFKEHGRNDYFQMQYGHLDLLRINWKAEQLPASDIITCEVFRDFRGWVDSVSKWAKSFEAKQWSCVDVREDIADHWQHRQTWNRAPVLLRQKPRGARKPLHLMEGHTRVGLLMGLVCEKILSEASRHSVWVGTTNQRVKVFAPRRYAAIGQLPRNSGKR
jgi:hypothetical protein